MARRRECGFVACLVLAHGLPLTMRPTGLSNRAGSARRGALIFANWPFTLIGIMPTNHKLKAIAEIDAGPTSRAMLVSWGATARRSNGARYYRNPCVPLGYELRRSPNVYVGFWHNAPISRGCFDVIVIPAFRSAEEVAQFVRGLFRNFL
jgi:hypothetical protein